MSLKNFLSFSALICALFFIYIGSFAWDSSFWQNLFHLANERMGEGLENELDWPRAFSILGFLLLGLNLLLYFLGKNWKLPLYLGIFAASMLLSLVVSTWILTN